MSAEAAPAAATTPSTATPPAPNTAPTATGAGPRQGLLASMVAPVEPARTTFTLNPATAAPSTPEGGTNMPPEGVSSAAFHDTNTPDNTKTNTPSRNGAGKPKQGMIRALVLAAATRWAKGGGTANKRLDMHKARAQADQVKETRQVTVNRTPASGPGGGAGAKGSGGGGGRSPKPSGSTGAGGGQGGKSLDRKSSGGSTKNSGSTGPKNNTTHTKPSNGPAGRGNTGSGHGGGGTSKPGGGKDTNRGGRTDTGTTTPKPTKTKDTTAAAPKTSTKPSPGGSTGAKGSAGGAGKPGKDGKTPTGTTNGKHTPASPRIPKQTTNDKTPGDTSKTPKPTPTTKPNLTKKKNQEPKAPTKGTDNPTKATPATKTTDTQTKPDSRTAPAAGPTKQPLATQPSRETGYRDGTRAAKAAAHARAYRDGVKDGWADTLAAADHEKTLLDQAHADRRNTRESEPPVTTPIASSADHHTEPGVLNTVQVAGIDAKNLHLGDHAARTTISRGEVRSLKQYERRLGERLTALHKAAETTKQLQAHAEGQAQQAQNLLEQAKSVQGGDKLTSALVRLADGAQKQAVEAGEIHKRAARSADACGAVLANVATRYSGMYQAVVDSPETTPAELSYYHGV